jgi:hypothetical protein
MELWAEFIAVYLCKQMTYNKLFVHIAHKYLNINYKIGKEWNYFTNTSFISYTEQDSWDPEGPLSPRESS